LTLKICIAAALAIPVALLGQPGISQNGVVNEASQIPPTLAGGALARGALFNVCGVRLASGARSDARLIQGATSVPLAVLQAAPRKLELRVPVTAALGSATLVITVDGRSSRPFPVEIVESNPGLFSLNQQGWGQGRIENIDAAGKRSENSIANPARPGQFISVAGTGMGEAQNIDVVVGDRHVTAVAKAPGRREGEDELRFAVPADAPQGCWVPVYVMAAPRRASNIVTMSLAPSSSIGTTSKSSANPSGDTRCDPRPVPMLAGKNTVTVVLSRIRTKSLQAERPDLVNDDARVAVRAASQTPVFSRNSLVPPLGTCRSYTSSYDADEEPSVSLSSLIVPEGRGLDVGGKLVLSRGSQTREIDELAERPGDYQGRLGLSGFVSRQGIPPPFLQPGQFVLRAPGGSGAGPFTTTATITPPFEWIDRDRITTVDRSRGLTVHWRHSGTTALMIIAAKNVDQLTTAIGACLCTARAAAGQFTIPPEILANMPISRGAPGERRDELLVGALVSKPIAPADLARVGAGVVFTAYGEKRFVDFK
jgi:uncharacterized protein (TIGR03437 family)